MKGREAASPRVLGILAWVIFTVLLTLGGVELLVRAGDLFPVPRAFTRAVEDVSNRASTGGLDAPASKRVPHPYLGWVHRPGFAGVNNWGFPSLVPDYRQVNEDEMVVAITGGSVALGMFVKGEQGLREGILEVRPDLHGKIRFLNFSLGGYKQPQQIFAVAQAVMLDVPIDAVINLDGFNEVALGSANAKRGSHPFFPRSSYWRQATDFAAGDLTPTQIEGMAVALEQRARLAGWRAGLEEGLLPRSELYRVFLGVRMLRAQTAAVAAEGKVVSGGGWRGKRKEPAVVEAMGPACTESRSCEGDVISVWLEGSRMLHDLCRSRGIAYLHALQPNQYAAPGKVMTEKEMAQAWDPDHPWSRVAKRLMPKLGDMGRAKLAPHGVEFLDLTGLFEHESGTVYIDTCCHFNEAGYTAIAREVGRGVARAYTKMEAPS